MKNTLKIKGKKLKLTTLGFTLIELLAVIVILAIIALIAVPIVLGIINDSKKSSEKESVKLYLDTTEKMVAKYQMKNTSFNPSVCDIQNNGNIKCNDTDIPIEMKGKTPTYGKIYFSKGKISIGENILLNGLYYQVQNNEVSDVTKEMVSGFSSVINRIELAVGNYTGTCEVTNTNKLTCGNEEKTIDTDKSITKGTITFTNGKITSYKNVNIDGTYYHKKEGGEENVSQHEIYANLVNDTGEQGLSIGDKYTYDVNDTDTFNFYVLSIEENQVNLIMDRNICNDGTVNYTSTNNYCRYAWYSGEKNNMYGPVTAIQELYEGTKEWNNVPTMELNYPDEFNRNKNNMGYISFIVTNGVGIITDKEKSSIVTIGTSNIPLKARLPKYSEATGAGCTKSNGTCPIWLMKNIAYYNVSDDKYSMNNNNESYQNIYGYWLLASLSGQTMYSCIVREYGRIHDRVTSSNNYVGIRPVITVPISDLN